jgi:RAB protein geranylgeranyltransferase component A
MNNIKMYLSSLNRFGQTAFIFPNYGVSEISQAFCRVGAVYNGTYVLRRGITRIYHNEEEIKGIKCTEKQYIKVKDIVANKSYQKETNEEEKKEMVEG